MGFECSEAGCVIATFYMCWKCGISKGVLHSGSTHVLYAIRYEPESDEEEEDDSDEEEDGETEGEQEDEIEEE